MCIVGGEAAPTWLNDTRTVWVQTAVRKLDIQHRDHWTRSAAFTGPTLQTVMGGPPARRALSSYSELVYGNQHSPDPRGEG
jgi:hypothetical protein